MTYDPFQPFPRPTYAWEVYGEPDPQDTRRFEDVLNGLDFTGTEGPPGPPGPPGPSGPTDPEILQRLDDLEAQDGLQALNFDALNLHVLWKDFAGTPYPSPDQAVFGRKRFAPYLSATNPGSGTGRRGFALMPSGTTVDGIPSTAFSGAPIGGTFAAGEEFVDASLARWRCVVGGTPGTWITMRNDVGVDVPGAPYVTSPLSLRNILMRHAGRWTGVFARLTAASGGGGSLLIQVKKNGTDIFAAGARPTIVSGGTVSTGGITFVSEALRSYVAGDYFQVLIDAVSPTPGTNLMISMMGD